MSKLSPYHKDISHLATLDPYRLQELYDMHPCAEHVVKKMLVAGKRSGGKDLDTDIADCIWTLQRWQEMRREDAGAELVGVVETTNLDSAERTFEQVFPPERPWQLGTRLRCTAITSLYFTRGKEYEIMGVAGGWRSLIDDTGKCEAYLDSDLRKWFVRA